MAMRLETRLSSLAFFGLLVFHALVSSGDAVALSGAPDGTGAHEKTVSGGSTLSVQIQGAKSYDPAFIAAQANVEAARQAAKAAGSSLGPRVSLSISAFRNSRTEESRNVFGQTIEIERDFNTRNAALQARQPLYRKRDSLALVQADVQVMAAEKSLLFAEQDLYLRVASAWIETLSARALEATHNEALGAAKEVSLEVGRLRIGGESTVQDVEQANARVAQARALLQDAGARRSIAERALRYIVGADASIPLQVSMAFFRSLPLAYKTELTLVDRVELANAEIASSRAQEEAARLEFDKARSDRLPTIDAIATASKGENDTLNSVKDEYRIGLQLNVPLYTHGGIDASVAQANANYQKFMAQTNSTRFRVKSEALASLGGLQALEERISAADALTAASSVLLRAQRIGLSAGVATRGEVARSLMDLLAAQRERVLIRKEYAVTWLKLQTSTGAFDESTLHVINELVFKVDSK